MTKYFKHLLIFYLALSSIALQAQKAVTIAFDPLTTVALGGYEVELGFNINKNRITASYLSGDLSPWFGQASDFESSSHSVFEIAYSRFLKDEQKGLSFGLAYAYYTDFTVEDKQGQSLEKTPSRVSLKLAYAWFPFKSIPLYLEPSMTFGFFLDDEDLNFTSGEVFDKKSFIGNSPLFNVGYKFNF
ncbi:MAG: hypothetical protein AB8H03_05520 [Saprospiraceae bacterium]